MDAELWFESYERLRLAFNKPRDPDQRRVYFEALQAIPAPTMRAAVDALLAKEDRFPRVHTIRDYCGVVGRQVFTPLGKCERCEGEGWIDVDRPQRIVINGEAVGPEYRNVVDRCPECRPSKASAA